MRVLSRDISKRLMILIIVSFLVGALFVTAIRFILIKSDSVHYHANYALYINGQEDPFSSPSFYEEEQLCNSDQKDNPKVRVHMHDNNAHLVHVHAHGVTWSQFFTNLGYTLGDNLIKTDAGIYSDGQDGNSLTFVINGEETRAVANRVIRSEDVLLINYGKDSDSTIHERYDAIPEDAHAANNAHDPATCSGGEELTMRTRLQKAVGF